MRREVIESGDSRVAILDYGARLQDWRVARDGRPLGIVLGHRDPNDYLADRHGLGMLAGRVAGRISGAKFELGGEVWRMRPNEGPNLLHGGEGGFGSRFWEMERDGPRAVLLRLASDHGDLGFPGKVEIEARLSISGTTLAYDIVARSDRPTPLSIAQHAYYNLLGAREWQGERRGEERTEDGILGHRVSVTARSWTPTAEGMIPTGEIAPLDEALSALSSGAEVGLASPGGFDANLVLDRSPCASGAGPGEMSGSGGTESRIDGSGVRDGAFRESLLFEAARVTASNGLALSLETDQPCLQFYTGHKLSTPFKPFAGLCLEPQGFPDAINRGFPPTMVSPDNPYRQRLRLTVLEAN